MFEDFSDNEFTSEEQNGNLVQKVSEDAHSFKFEEFETISPKNYKNSTRKLANKAANRAAKKAAKKFYKELAKVFAKKKLKKKAKKADKKSKLCYKSNKKKKHQDDGFLTKIKNGLVKIIPHILMRVASKAIDLFCGFIGKKRGVAL